MNYQNVDLISKLSDRARKNNLLKMMIAHFKNDYNLVPWFGAEIEFYLTENIIINQLEDILNVSIKSERGNNQFEVAMIPSSDLEQYSYNILKLRQDIINTAKLLGGAANFNPKPFINDYGNSIQFNLSFSKTESTRVTSSSNDKMESFDQIAKILCHYMLETYLIFMPFEKDYARTDQRFMAPTHVSYGNNNRTTAIRIIKNLRIEHRLASSSVDPYMAMLTILKTISLGWLKPQKITDITKIYGNAFDEQYNLTMLPKNRSEALKYFNINFFSK